MTEQQKKKSQKKVIIILAILLILSIIALAGALIQNKLTEQRQDSVVVPKNIITTEAGTEAGTEISDNSNTDSEMVLTSYSTNKTDINPQNGNAADNSTDTGSNVKPDTDKNATTLHLYNRHQDDNTPFEIVNMLPGDAETKYYCIRVSHDGTVAIHFQPVIRAGSEKLAEVLKCRVVLLSTGETMYDGLMRDMTESVNCELTADKKTTDELYYEVTAYLETSVGNEYTEQDLIADFKWWVDETGNLTPETADNTDIFLWICLALASSFMLILLSNIHRKEEEQYER